MPERRTDPDTRGALDQRLDKIEAGYLARADTNHGLIQKYGRRTTRMLTLLAVVLIGLGILNIILNDNRVDDIQQSRVDITYGQCQGLNKRNRDTKAQLDAILKRVPANRQERAQASRVATGLLIDALAPVTDCEKQLDQRFGKSAVPSPDVR